MADSEWLFCYKLHGLKQRNYNQDDRVKNGLKDGPHDMWGRVTRFVKAKSEGARLRGG